MRRSWIEWVSDLVDRAPVPRWLVYATVLATWSFVTIVVHWGLEAPAFPDVVLSPIVGAAFPVLLLWAIQVLNGVADRALATLRPATDLDAAEQKAFSADLRRTPPEWALLALPLGLTIGLTSVLDGYEGWELHRGDPAVLWALTFIVSGSGMIMAFGFVIHIVHQLQLVDRIHRRIGSIDLFALEPLYAFARLTALTGVTLIAVVVGGWAWVTVLISSFELATSDYLAFGVLLVVAVASFILPLLGLHARLEDERDRKLAEAHAALSTALAEVRRRIAAGDLDGAARINDAVAAANTGVQVVSRVSTWPWRPETLRGFLSAVLLPILLWVVITVLGRLLPT